MGQKKPTWLGGLGMLMIYGLVMMCYGFTTGRTLLP